jgi:hypothetical protein
MHHLLLCQHVKPMRSFLWALALISTMGCATTHYRYGGDYFTDNDGSLKPSESQIERGRRAPVLDAVGWIVGLPSKIIMLDHHVNNHDVSPNTELSIKQYLACNGMDKVKVRINEYDPCGEWGRLVRNKSVGWPARYTIGTLTVVGYTLLPGRVFGWDGYNPFTNTISLYSDVPTIALYEGSHAKDYAQREYKGLYAVSRVVPGIGLWQDYKASNETMSYITENGTAKNKKEGYRTICPTFAFSACEPFVALTGAPLVLPAVVTGHVVGQVKAASIDESGVPDTPGPEASPASYPEPMR